MSIAKFFAFQILNTKDLFDRNSFVCNETLECLYLLNILDMVINYLRGSLPTQISKTNNGNVQDLILVTPLILNLWMINNQKQSKIVYDCYMKELWEQMMYV